MKHMVKKLKTIENYGNRAVRVFYGWQCIIPICKYATIEGDYIWAEKYFLEQQKKNNESYLIRKGYLAKKK